MAAVYYLFNGAPVTGGDLVAQEHVAALDRMGFRAAAFYCAQDEGYRQFTVPVARPGTTIAPDDVLVLGETQREWLALAGDMNCIRVLHNQAPYYTFFGFANVAGLNAYPFAHVLVASDHAAALLRALGVSHPIARVHPAVPEFFTPGRAKNLQITFSPTKRQAEALFLAQYFKAQAPAYAHVPWLPLGGFTRRACAQIMAVSAIHAALPQLEGLGLMPLEAMASGCHVVGYTGHGGGEYATAQNGDWIADGDHDGFVAAISAACLVFESGAPNPKVDGGIATAAGFSQAAFETQLHQAWSQILDEKAALYRR